MTCLFVGACMCIGYVTVKSCFRIVMNIVNDLFNCVFTNVFMNLHNVFTSEKNVYCNANILVFYCLFCLFLYLHILVDLFTSLLNKMK